MRHIPMREPINGHPTLENPSHAAVCIAEGATLVAVLPDPHDPHRFLSLFKDNDKFQDAVAKIQSGQANGLINVCACQSRLFTLWRTTKLASRRSA